MSACFGLGTGAGQKLKRAQPAICGPLTDCMQEVSQQLQLPYNMAFSASQAGLLDRYVIIAASPHSDAVGDPDLIRETFLLYETRQMTKDDKMYWTWHPVKNPQRLVGGPWELGEEGDVKSYWHYRHATNASEAATYHSWMNRGKKSIYLGGDIRQRVYVWTIDMPNTILPSTYYHCCHGLDTGNEWCFRASASAEAEAEAEAEPGPEAGPKPMNIPTHVLRSFMDSAIQRGDTCPIILEPFTKEMIAYTSCGHLFDHASIVQCTSCPNCRARLGPDDIRKY